MVIDQYFKIFLVTIGLALWTISFKLWFSPKEALAENLDITSRLSYISKVVGAIESSVIKIEGDLRFVKRQVDLSMKERNLSGERFNTLETKMTTIKGLVDSIEMNIDEMDGNITYIENDIDSLTSGSCNNIFLCRQKKY